MAAAAVGVGYLYHYLLVLLLLMIIIISSSSTSHASCDGQHRSCLHHSKTTFFNQTSPTPPLLSGACGYGSMALSFYAGHLAAAVPAIYKDGAGCGACFQIRCKNPKVCTRDGTKVIVVDLINQNNTNNSPTETDLVLSSRAFRGMAVQGRDQDILRLATLDADYYRIPCDYSRNLGIRVEESSHKSNNYLAIKFLYQGGQTEIVGVDVASQVESPNWTFMSRNHGAVWDTNRAPSGALQLRLVVTAGYDGKYTWAKHALPSDWKNGVVYDSGVQITDVAQEPGCAPCHAL